MKFHCNKRLWCDDETYGLLGVMLAMCEPMSKDLGQTITLKDLVNVMIDSWADRMNNGKQVDRKIVCQSRSHYLTLILREDILKKFERMCGLNRISLENGFKMAMFEYNFE